MAISVNCGNQTAGALMVAYVTTSAIVAACFAMMNLSGKGEQYWNTEYPSLLNILGGLVGLAAIEAIAAFFFAAFSRCCCQKNHGKKLTGAGKCLFGTYYFGHIVLLVLNALWIVLVLVSVKEVGQAMRESAPDGGCMSGVGAEAMVGIPIILVACTSICIGFALNILGAIGVLCCKEEIEADELPVRTYGARVHKRTSAVPFAFRTSAVIV